MQENEGITMVKSESKIIKKRDFPIKNFSKIELVSYYNRIYWDTLNYKGKFPSSKVLVDNYRLTFDSTMIEERVILNKSQETELLNLMVCDTCVPQEVSAACYNPRHMILFRDNKNRIIGYNEFCLSCVGGRTSPSLDNFQKYCYSDMEILFRKFGIKLFVDYDDEKKEYKILEKKGYLKY
ncbi:hypothetical protein [Flavobacterium lipolyticum]|uniref:Uncharacterized protein n=1 Tax=Flavobacterium lipolyticum TaxID=2893754 RepID=A0ABS8M3E6_9FLAO|nr:hypothetical protein [Flavobacterium sp. F-126]MCC9019325.1 hypothetical protein [Flavobacterium sp. F-126]